MSRAKEKYSHDFFLVIDNLGEQHILFLKPSKSKLLLFGSKFLDNALNVISSVKLNDLEIPLVHIQIICHWENIYAYARLNLFV